VFDVPQLEEVPNSTLIEPCVFICDIVILHLFPDGKFSLTDIVLLSSKHELFVENKVIFVFGEIGVVIFKIM